MSTVRQTRTCRLRRIFAIAVAVLVATPDAVLATSGTTASKSMDAMSPQELEHFVQQLNESANWRKYRRATDPPDFVPGKPVKVMHGAGSSFGRSGGGGGSGGFRKSGLGNRRGARSGRGKNRDDAMAQGRGSSRSGRSGSGSSSGFSSRSNSGSSSRSSSGSSSRSRSNAGFGSSSRNSGSSFGNSNNNDAGGFDQ